MSPRSESGRKPNIVFFGIDSLRADHMSLYGYPRLTTPHMDRFAREGVAFEKTFSPHIPTTSGYSSMLTGMDVFATEVVALRHQGRSRAEVKTLPEMLGEQGYNTTCVGFSGNPASRGFENYIDFPGWGCWNEGRSPRRENLNEVTIPELERLAEAGKPFFLFLRHMDPHSPYLPPAPFERMFYHGNEMRPEQPLDGPGHGVQAVLRLLCELDAAGHHRQGLRHRPVRRRGRLHGRLHPALSSPRLESRGWWTNTLVVINADHGETLYDHDCYFDHHGLYEPTLHVPLIIRYPGQVPAGKRVGRTPAPGPRAHDPGTAGIDAGIQFDGQSLLPLHSGQKPRSTEPEFYITECTWMRKHGWRTPEWKLIHALEPDFHCKPRGRAVQPDRKTRWRTTTWRTGSRKSSRS